MKSILVVGFALVVVSLFGITPLFAYDGQWHTPPLNPPNSMWAGISEPTVDFALIAIQIA
ncbi:MAG: hypothetical protein HYS87_03755 [Candidatus Colwellbacteria bacterium]|nr:hypothetical protein [Candidatus Colwellbacteria bacterium]